MLGFNAAKVVLGDGVAMKGAALAEQLTEADVVSSELTFAEPVVYIHAWNRDAAQNLVLTVNTVVLTIPPHTVLGPLKVGSVAAAVVGVSGTSAAFIVSRCE